jgi:diamine N-acetyltransferase
MKPPPCLAAPEEALPHRDAPVSLREVTKETLRDVLRLKVAPEQERFVAPNAVSIADAYFEPLSWFRAVHAGETPVGFAMLYDNPGKPAYFLWRFMIDRRFQGLGFGARAIALLVEHVKTRPGAAVLTTHCVPGEGSPCPFYERMGFADTGQVYEGERVMRLELA